MKNAQALALTPLRAVNVTIDKNDVIAIQVAKAERLLNDELKAAQDAMKTHEKTLKGHADDLTKSYAQTAKDAAATAMGLLKTLADEFSGLSKRWVEHAVADDGLRVQIKFGGDYQNGTLTKTVPFTAEQVLQRATIKNTQDAVAEAQARVVAARQKLAKLPSLERQYRAALAEKTLATTAEGQAVLDAIGSDIKADVLALPG